MIAGEGLGHISLMAGKTKLSQFGTSSTHEYFGYRNGELGLLPLRFSVLSNIVGDLCYGFYNKS